MTSEFENNKMAGEYSSKGKKCKKCCQTGLHLTKNGTCIQAMRPFSSLGNSSQHASNESEFVKLILESKVEKGPPSSFEDHQADVLEIDSIIQQLESCFEK
ncbi:uncharacterized protein VICG_00492 [Vittaforma corneae ATCC 50505]|uniref:Uncharacterized protein n=1 Tax=Vittaforma corneae (strain ATCC 50505) TaxID=993615 RepID=L2GNB7_VITCO|nr:uncharacterized protein VICG_00492 [Vittaforma corneae ATCC 50505]ELA42393.1 hypothetical protein VICG_00492 [Vittaforma corneae ATCC 50505]